MKKKYYIVVNSLCSVPTMVLEEYKGHTILVGGYPAKLFKTRKEANKAVRDTHAFARQEKSISRSKRTLRLWTTHKVYSCVVEE